MCFFKMYIKRTVCVHSVYMRILHNSWLSRGFHCCCFKFSPFIPSSPTIECFGLLIIWYLELIFSVQSEKITELKFCNTKVRKYAIQHLFSIPHTASTNVLASTLSSYSDLLTSSIIMTSWWWILIWLFDPIKPCQQLHCSEIWKSSRMLIILKLSLPSISWPASLVPQIGIFLKGMLHILWHFSSCNY